MKQIIKLILLKTIENIFIIIIIKILIFQRKK
jgi:hypothetical protein